jgi:hypothetical protein
MKPDNARMPAGLILAAAIAFATLQPAHAEPEAGFGGLSGPWSPSYRQTLSAAPSWTQASAGEAGAAARGAQGADVPDAMPWYERNNLHKYLGLGTIALTALTIVSPKKEDGPHEYFAVGAATLAVATVATGVFAHWDDIEASWRNPDTQHAALGTAGALLMLAAVARGGEGGHAGLGVLGAVGIAVAVKLAW